MAGFVDFARIDFGRVISTSGSCAVPSYSAAAAVRIPVVISPEITDASAVT